MAAHRLGHEIGAVLLMKVAALTLLYFAFFDASHRQTVSPTAMAAKLFSASETPDR